MKFAMLDADIAVAPQPPLDDLARIAAAGFRGIINNRPDGEDPAQPSSAEMAAEAQRLGLAYWHIPILPGKATQDDARQFVAAVHAADGPVLAYCRSGNRSRQVWQLAKQLS